MYLTDPYQYSDYPPPYNYKPDPYGAKASSAAAHGMSAAVAGPMDYSAYGSGHSACAYPGAMGSAYLGPHPGAYSYDDLAAAARLSSYSSFNKGKNGRAKGKKIMSKIIDRKHP